MGHEVLAEADGIRFRVATPADADAVMQLLTDEFFPNMSVYKHLKMKEDPQFVKDLIPPAMASGVSIVAEKIDTGELIAARVNTISKAKADNLPLPMPEDSATAEKYRRHGQLIRMVDKLEFAVDFFQLYNVDEAVACRMLGVKQAYGKRGIGKRLQQLTLELAKKRNIHLVVGTTESFYTQKIYESLGFKVLHRLQFKDYVDPPSGEKPFVEMDNTEHKDATLFALPIA